MATGDDGDENEFISFEVDFAQTPSRVDRPQRDAGRSERSAPRWLAAAGGGAALVLLWILTSLTSSDGPPPQVEIETEPAEQALVVPTPPPTPLPTATPLPTPKPPSFLDTQAAAVGRNQLFSAAPGMSVVYLSDGDVGRLDFGTGEASELRSEATSLWGFDGGSLLRARDGSVYGVEPNNLDLVHVASKLGRASMMAPDESDPEASFLAYADGAAPTEAVVLELGRILRPTTIQVPEGARLRAVDTLGLLAYDPAVGTSVATRDGFQFLSAGQILTASEGAWIEVRCESPEQCTLVLVDRDGGDDQLLPEGFTIDENNYLIAPDGRQVLRWTPEGFSEIYRADSGDTLFVSSTGMQAPAWSPDSTFVAWLDLDGEAKLWLMRPGTRDWISVKIKVLDALPPTEHGLVVVANSEFAG